MPRIEYLDIKNRSTVERTMAVIIGSALNQLYVETDNALSAEERWQEVLSRLGTNERELELYAGIRFVRDMEKAA